MLSIIQQFADNLNKPKTCLLIGNVLLVFVLIILNNLKIIPLKLGDFTFFTLLALALAMYRPGWAFLVFIGTIPLENINLAPAELGLAVRPYQLFGALVLFAIIIRKFSGRLNFPLIKFRWFDYLILATVFGGFLSVISAPDKTLSFKLAAILSTFAALYFLVRNYIQTVEDVKRVTPFFLSSSVIVVLYGIWQNIGFMNGLESFEIMPGRSNATFSEPDWLGIYLVLLLGIVYSLLHRIFDDRDAGYQILNAKYFMLATLYVMLIASYVLLILTVSRSAWLGAAVTTFFYLFAILTGLRFKDWQWEKFFKNAGVIFSAGIISLAGVYVFNLTNFQLFNRAQSVASGLQKITISCPDNDCDVREIIDDISDLDVCRCRHINLEEIDAEKAEGNLVSEVYRKDPNVSRRSEIYQKSWHQIKNNPLLGIGWGSIGQVLGRDERGSLLNSSNIFLEVWLGSGASGVLALIVFFLYIFFGNIRNYFSTRDFEFQAFSLFMIIGGLAIIIPNLFNAGIMLGFLWVYLGLAGVTGE